jgi:hypothetical protein
MIEEIEATKVADDSRAMELLRVWLVDGKPTVVITRNLWEDPAAWGLLLADVVRHLGNAYEALGRGRGAVLARVKKAFEVEWDSPTSQAETIDQ